MIIKINKELILQEAVQNNLIPNTVVGSLQGAGMMGLGSQLMPVLTGNEDMDMDLGHAILTGSLVGAGKGIVGTGISAGMDKYNIPNPKEVVYNKVKEISK